MGNPVDRDAVIAALRGMTDVDRAVVYAEANTLGTNDAREQLRTEVAKLIGDERAAAFVNTARFDALCTDGAIDPAKVSQQIGTLYGIQRTPANYGQGGTVPGLPGIGAAGRAAATKRHGTYEPPPGQSFADRSAPGAAGRSALAKRFEKTDGR